MKDKLFRTVTLVVLGCLLLFPASAKESPGDNSKVREQNITREDQNVTLQQEQTDHEMVKQVIGAVEKVRIIPGNIILDARIDTGATTTSLGVDEIEILNEDGKKWAEITVNDIKSKHEIISFTKIKQQEKEPLKRPVIRLRLILGEVSESVDVTLANRSNFKYKLLIGRNFLHERFIVDVSLKHTRFPKVYEEK
ncbi:MAG: RimK/LysX family protein [Sulfurovum sp.]|nr:RimK/LysX family protein [Sulfurovum sp.]